MTLSFILNEQTVAGNFPPGMVLLDFIRGEKRLLGTKIGCREGDCGACTVLVGELENGRVRYRSMTSCLLPLGNVIGKHVVTIEGLNPNKGLTPVQEAMVSCSGTQCGFCTVGFVVSLHGFCMGQGPFDQKGGIAAVDGNICRCTGYKSIERAVEKIVTGLNQQGEMDLDDLVAAGYLPAYFLDIGDRLKEIHSVPPPSVVGRIVGGGTDLYVQRPEEMAHGHPEFLFDKERLRRIEEHENVMKVGASVTAQDLRDSQIMRRFLPGIRRYMKLVSSTPIRNMGTVAGNLVNASPIGDLTILFLALGTQVDIEGSDGTRVLPLKDLYLDYKKLDLEEGERIVALFFHKHDEHTLFNFEKVSKRTHLDIASVNSAACIRVVDGEITNAALAAGGVAPVPLFLRETSEFLIGRKLDVATVKEAAAIADSEAKPISDARGSDTYKRLLLRQLIFAHFTEMFPDKLELEALV